MKAHHKKQFVQKQMACVIQAAMLTMLAASAAHAAEAIDPAVAELTQPTREISVGITTINQDSAKFGEYNGLNQKGVYGDVGFEWGWQGDENSAMRWRAEGTNLGLDTRRIELGGGQQGLYDLNFKYYEIPHRVTDSFQTIYNGTGGTAQTLPAAYPATRPSTWSNIAADPAYTAMVKSLHNVDIGTKRKDIAGGASYEIFPGWSASVSAQEERKEGTKLTGAGLSGNPTGAGGGLMLVEPIHYKTDTVNLGLAYVGEKINAHLDYNYSAFRNDVTSWTATTPFATGSLWNNQIMMSSAPDNDMQQLGGGFNYRFTPTTQLAVEASTNKMTQNSAFNCQTSAAATCVGGRNGWVLPENSANARVDNDAASLKLTSRPTAGLSLAATYRYDRRDNSTPIQTFAVRGTDSNATTGTTTSYTNSPLNVTKQRGGVEADYAFLQGQAIKVGYDTERTSRTGLGTGLSPEVTLATVNTTSNIPTTDFVAPASKTQDNTWRIEYRNTVVENLSGNLSYARTDRKGSGYQFPNLATNSTTAISTNMTNQYYMQFVDSYVASRTQDKIRGALGYQFSNAWSADFSFDYNADDYSNSAMQSARVSAYNFDVAYAPTDKLSITAFYTLGKTSSSLNGLYVATSPAPYTTAKPGAWGWNIAEADTTNTLGLSGKYKGLMSGKLDLQGDLTYDYARSETNANNGNGVLPSGGTALISATDLPVVHSKTVALQLTGHYHIDKKQKIRLSYLYQHLNSDDWQYDAYHNADNTVLRSYLGTGQTSPNYNIQSFNVLYTYDFI